MFFLWIFCERKNKRGGLPHINTGGFNKEQKENYLGMRRKQKRCGVSRERMREKVCGATTEKIGVVKEQKKRGNIIESYRVEKLSRKRSVLLLLLPRLFFFFFLSSF